MAFRLNKDRFSSAVAAVLAMGLISTVTLADVPTSVAVRPQSPDVERVISQLELKAAAGEGTWTTRAGRQDVPAEPWKVSLLKREWTLKSDANAPSGSAGYCLYCDGVNSFELPDAVRFQNDMLTRGKFQDFRLGHYLMLLNLEPRQLIGCLGNLKLMERTVIGGVQCVHLRAELAKDPLLDADSSIKLRLAPLPTLDIYVDPQRQSVTRVLISDPSGYCFESTATTWDSFGTSATWPKNILGKTLYAPNTTRDAAKPYLLTVEKFSPGPAKDLNDVKSRIASESFFSAPLDYLRSVEFYQRELAKDPTNLSSRVALIQAAFNDADVKTGLEGWSSVEDQLTAQSDRERLRKILVPHAGYGLLLSSKDKTQVPDCVALMRKVLKEVPVSELSQIEVSMFAAWETLYSAPENRPSLHPVNAPLMDFFTTQSNQYVFERMIALGNRKDSQAFIAPYLQGVVAHPMPATGYAGSSLSYLVAATLECQDYKGARDYLQHIVWDPTTPDDKKSEIPQLTSAIDHLVGLKDQPSAIGPMVESFDAFNGSLANQDKITSSEVRKVLVNATARTIAELANKNDNEVQKIFTKTASLHGADVFWRNVLTGLVSIYAPTPNRLIAHVGPLAGLYGAQFGKADYASQFWRAMARSRRGFLGIQVDYLNKALVFAPDDPTRFAVIRQLSSTYGQSREYTLGAQAVEGASHQLQDPSLIKKAQQISDSLKQAGKREQELAQKSQNEREKIDQQKKLAYMKKQLNVAKGRGASPEDVASLEKVIASMSRDPANDTTDRP